MEFAVLGPDRGTLSLLRAIHASPKYDVVEFHDASSEFGEFRELFPNAQFREDWPSLLSLERAGAVIVGGGGQGPRDEQLRQLAQAAVPMVLVHPACEAILGFELDMIQRDTGAMMLPFQPDLLHPAVDELRQWLRNESLSPVGRSEQLVMERTSSDRSRDFVLQLLARDALLFHYLLGDFEQVGAMGGNGEQASLSNLSVHFTGGEGIVARWSISPTKQSPGATLGLIGTHGKAVLRATGDGPWTLESSGETNETRQYDDWSREQAIVGQLDKAIGGKSTVASWEAACRAMDLADLAEQSVRRGKTLAVHNERLTEEDTFKSMMAAGGCLLLMFALVGLLVVAVIEGLGLPIRDSTVWRLWPLVLLGVLGVFLLLQTLKLLFPKNS